MTEVSVNNKIWGFKGAIGRREYILNSTIFCAVVTFFIIPYIFWITIHVNDFIGMSTWQIVKFSPLFVKVPFLVCWLVGIPIVFGLSLRRFNDIIGRDTYIVSILAIAALISVNDWASFANNMLLLFVAAIFHILLYCIKGKVTGALPKDEVKRFNWGAFWGTWIWGLINRSYKTLWAIPALILFPIFPYVQIICGIKGNEWAYEKAKNKELPVFHKGQKHQAIFWNIFAGVGVILLPILAIIIMTVAAIGYAVANPEKMEQVRQEYQAKVEQSVDEYFDKFELGNNENKFYINPQKWVEMDYNQKFSVYNFASSYAYSKKSDPQNENHKISTLQAEKAITKIYSSYNNELLAEYNLDAIDTTDLKSIVESSMRAFQINENPKLP